MPSRRPLRRPAPPAYLIVGEDSYQRALFREEIIAAHVPAEARDMAVARYALDETPLEEVLGRAATPPLFSPSQVLLLTAAEAVSDEQLERLEKYLESPPDCAVLIFEADKLDRRTRAARFLLERCQVLAAEPLEDTAAVEAARRFARELGLTLGRGAAEDLVFVLGNDQSRLRAELQKLRSYVGEHAEITSDDVAAVISPARQFSVFELADLLAERRRADILVRLRRLLEAGESPVGIVGLLGWLYRQLLQAHALPRNTPVGKAAETLRAPRMRVEGLLRQARKFRPEELRQAFEALLEADVALKSSPPDPVAILEVLVARLTPLGKKEERSARA